LEVIVVEEVERAYNLHAKDVYRYLLSLSRDEDVAEELTQETFFRAMRTVGSFDGTCKLSVWLCQIGKHLWYQWLEKRSKEKRGEFTDDLQGGWFPESQAVFGAEKTALYKAIHSLDEPMREVVHMRLTGEFSFGEIGGILGKSENWARTTFYRAKLKIIERMEGLT
jgi:RNA polymerase sigma-70 factor (ECF subfamily)